MGLIGVGDGRDPHPISIPAEAVVLTSLGQGQGQDSNDQIREYFDPSNGFVTKSKYNFISYTLLHPQYMH